MSKLRFLLRRSYLFVIIGLFYVPLFFAAVFSFNTDPKKGSMSFGAFDGFSSTGWEALFDATIANNHTEAIINSFLIAIPVATIVILLSLITVYSLWRQKVKAYKMWVDGTANIPLINPDIVTAVGLVLAFGLMFGQLQFGDTGYFRAVVAHIVMILPYGITIMYPRSTKFQASLLEASKDLGFGPVRTWMRTYLVHMVPVIAGVLVISMVLSLDDYVITRMTYSSPAIGKELYNAKGGQVRSWSLAIGTAMLILLFSGIGSFAIYKTFKAHPQWRTSLRLKRQWKNI